jgi:hypothetical protein
MWATAGTGGPVRRQGAGWRRIARAAALAVIATVFVVGLLVAMLEPDTVDDLGRQLQLRGASLGVFSRAP